MSELIDLLYNYGISFVIVLLFIYDWITNKTDIKKSLKQNEKALDEISSASKNTAKSLELLKQSMSEQKSDLLLYDKRCTKIEYVVEEIKSMIEEFKI